MAAKAAALNKPDLLQQAQSWVAERLAVMDLFDETFTDRAKTNPWYTVGALFYFSWVVVLVTGFWLLMWYTPTIEQGYASIERIQHEIPLGWLFRAVHKYAGDAMIILATMRAYRFVFTGDYKKPYEIVYFWSIIVIIVCMYSGLTGYLLIWNQRAFWATKVMVTFPTYIDLTPGLGFQYFGRNTAFWWLGGGSIGQGTMTNFLTAHYALSIIGFLFIEQYFWRTKRRRMNMSWQHMLLTLGIIVMVVFLRPSEMGTHANPTVTPNPILSDWYFLALYQLMKYQHPVTATWVTVFIPAVAILCAFLDVRPERSLWQRPGMAVVSIGAFVQWIALSVLIIMNIADIQRDPPFWYISFLICGVLGGWLEWEHFKKTKVTKGLWALPVFANMVRKPQARPPSAQARTAPAE